MPLGGTHWMGGLPQLQRNRLRQRDLGQLSGVPAWTAGELPARPCLVQCCSLHTHIACIKPPGYGAMFCTHNTAHFKSHGCGAIPAHTTLPASRLLASSAVCAAKGSEEDAMSAPSLV